MWSCPGNILAYYLDKTTLLYKYLKTGHHELIDWMSDLQHLTRTHMTNILISISVEKIIR